MDFQAYKQKFITNITQTKTFNTNFKEWYTVVTDASEDIFVYRLYQLLQNFESKFPLKIFVLSSLTEQDIPYIINNQLAYSWIDNEEQIFTDIASKNLNKAETLLTYYKCFLKPGYLLLNNIDYIFNNIAINKKYSKKQIANHIFINLDDLSQISAIKSVDTKLFVQLSKNNTVLFNWLYNEEVRALGNIIYDLPTHVFKENPERIEDWWKLWYHRKSSEQINQLIEHKDNNFILNFLKQLKQKNITYKIVSKKNISNLKELYNLNDITNITFDNINNISCIYQDEDYKISYFGIFIEATNQTYVICFEIPYETDFIYDTILNIINQL